MSCPHCELPMTLHHAAASCWGVVEVWTCECGVIEKANTKYDGTPGTRFAIPPLDSDGRESQAE